MLRDSCACSRAPRTHSAFVICISMMMVMMMYFNRVNILSWHLSDRGDEYCEGGRSANYHLQGLCYKQLFSIAMVRLFRNWLIDWLVTVWSVSARYLLCEKPVLWAYKAHYDTSSWSPRHLVTRDKRFTDHGGHIKLQSSVILYSKFNALTSPGGQERKCNFMEFTQT